MRRFVKGIESDPASRIVDSSPGLGCAKRETLENARELPTQRIGLRGLPFIELDTIAEGEPRKEVAGIGRHRILETAFRHERPKAVDVHIYRGEVQRDAEAVSAQLLAPETRA